MDSYLNEYEMISKIKIQEISQGIFQESDNLKNIVKSAASIGVELEKAIFKINQSALELQKEASNTLNTVLIIIAITALSLFIIISILITHSITSSLSSIQQGLNSFFSFLNRETNKAEPIKLDSKDEFGVMASAIVTGKQIGRAHV